MLIRSVLSATLTAVLACGAFAAPAPDAWEDQVESWENQVKPNSLTAVQGISAEQATTIVRRETGGRVLSATAVDGGKGGYRVRVLVDGARVTTLHVSPLGQLEEDR